MSYEILLAEGFGLDNSIEDFAARYGASVNSAVYSIVPGPLGDDKALGISTFPSSPLAYFGRVAWPESFLDHPSFSVSYWGLGPIGTPELTEGATRFVSGVDIGSYFRIESQANQTDIVVGVRFAYDSELLTFVKPTLSGWNHFELFVHNASYDQTTLICDYGLRINGEEVASKHFEGVLSVASAGTAFPVVYATRRTTGVWSGTDLHQAITHIVISRSDEPDFLMGPVYVTRVPPTSTIEQGAWTNSAATDPINNPTYLGAPATATTYIATTSATSSEYGTDPLLDKDIKGMVLWARGQDEGTVDIPDSTNGRFIGSGTNVWMRSSTTIGFSTNGTTFTNRMPSGGTAAYSLDANRTNLAQAVVLYWDGTTKIAVTSNYGVSWTNVPKPAAVPALTSTHRVHLVGSSIILTKPPAFISFDSPTATAYRTSNNGASWTTLATPLADVIVDGNNVFSLPVTGMTSTTILKSADGGATWSTGPVLPEIITFVSIKPGSNLYAKGVYNLYIVSTSTLAIIDTIPLPSPIPNVSIEYEYSVNSTGEFLLGNLYSPDGGTTLIQLNNPGTLIGSYIYGWGTVSAATRARYPVRYVTASLGESSTIGISGALGSVSRIYQKNEIGNVTFGLQTHGL